MSDKEKKYLKFDLELGYAQITERDYTPMWFPFIDFFDNGGKIVLTVHDDSVAIFFEVLKELRFRNVFKKESVCHFYQGFRTDYDLFRENDKLHIIEDDEIEGDIGKALVIISKDDAAKLVNGIMTLK